MSLMIKKTIKVYRAGDKIPSTRLSADADLVISREGNIVKDRLGLFNQRYQVAPFKAHRDLEQRVATLEQQLKAESGDVAPTPTVNPCLEFPQGTPVIYSHVDSTRWPEASWEGVVIPRPAGLPAVGTRGSLVWVMKDYAPHNVVGCYPWNLRKV